MDRSTTPVPGGPWLLSVRAIDTGFVNPYCHATTIAETPTGLVLAFFGGPNRNREGQALWFATRAEDGWAPPRCVAPCHGNATMCWNPVLHQAPGGALLLFFKQGENCAEWSGRRMRSDDGGRTWGPVEPLPPGFWGPVRTPPRILRDGSLLCPSSTEAGRWQVHFERTADLGRTWTRTRSVVDDVGFQAIQPTLLVWPSGLLQALCRTRAGVIAQTWSDDDGRTWMPLEATPLPNPNSAVDAAMLPDGRALLVYNDVTCEAPGYGGPRTPLSVAVSRDGCAWTRVGHLETDPGEFSYPCVLPTADGLVHVTYTTGIGSRGMRHAVIDPAAIPGGR